MSNPRLSFRCPEHHALKARRRAKRQGVSLSVALRALLCDYAEGRVPTVPVLKILGDLREELRRIGINLNQATRALNQGHRVDLEPIVARLAKTYRRLYGVLSDHVLARRSK